MKKLSILSTLFVLFLTTKANTQTLKENAYKLFDNYKPKIEKAEQLAVQYRTAYIGDLNNDNLEDVILVFGLGAKGSNGVLYNQAAVYLNKGNNKLKVVSGFEPNYCLGISKIEKGIVFVEKYGSCSDLSTKSSKIRKYVLKNNKLVKFSN